MSRYLRLQHAAREDAVLDQAVVRAWLRDLDVVMRGLLEWQLLAARYTERRSLTVSVQAVQAKHALPERRSADLTSTQG